MHHHKPCANASLPVPFLKLPFDSCVQLYQASRFQQDQSNANARKVFLCSLWYLPFLLAAYVFHSRNWRTVELEDDAVLPDGENANGLSEFVLQTKETLKGMCIHEVVVNNNSNIATPSMCPKVVADKGALKAIDAVVDILETDSDNSTGRISGDPRIDETSSSSTSTPES